jgi:hypothetical protein
MIEHKRAMDWFDEMKSTYAEVEVFCIDMNDKLSRGASIADKGSEGSRQVVAVVTPYKVVDRLGRHESATQASMTVQAHHKRAQLSDASAGGRLLFWGVQQPLMLQQQWMLRPHLPLLLQRQRQQRGLHRLLLVHRQHGLLVRLLPVSYLGLFSLEIEICLGKIILPFYSFRSSDIATFDETENGPDILVSSRITSNLLWMLGKTDARRMCCGRRRELPSIEKVHVKAKVPFLRAAFIRPTNVQVNHVKNNYFEWSKFKLLSHRGPCCRYQAHSPKPLSR